MIFVKKVMCDTIAEMDIDVGRVVVILASAAVSSAVLVLVLNV